MKTSPLKIFKFITWMVTISVLFLSGIYKSDRTSLEIKDSQGLIEHEEVRIEPKSVLKHKYYNFDDDTLTITGKICLANHTEIIIRECFERYENYNYEWILLADNINYFISIFNLITNLKNYTSIPAKIVSIVVNNETMIIDDSYTDGMTPIFYTNEKIYNMLSLYDISNISENYMVYFFYIKLDSILQNKISLYISIAIAGIIFIVFSSWHSYTFKIYASFSTSIQKSFFGILYIKLVHSLLLIYYAYLNIKRASLPVKEENFLISYADTIITTLSDVLQSLLWYLLIVIAYGWQIHKGLFTRNEVKNSIMVFILLYILICFDKIFDVMIERSWWQPSDIKNILLYSLLTIFIYIYCNKSKKIITTRFVYAINFSVEYYPSLSLKIKMMNMQILFTFAYTIVYIVTTILCRTILSEKITKEFSVIIYYVINTTGFFFYLIIYYPRKFPQHFSVFYDNNINDTDNQINMNTYMLKLNSSDIFLRNETSNSYSKIITSEKINNKKSIEIMKSNNFPIFVINPLFNSLCFENNKKLFNFMEHMTIGIKNNNQE